MEEGGWPSRSVADNTTGEGSKWQREREREEGLKRRERGECHFLALMPPFLSLWGGYLKDVHLEAQSKQALQERLCYFADKERGFCGHPIRMLLASLIAWSQLLDLHSQQVGKSRGDAELSLFVCAHSRSPGTNASLALSQPSFASTTRYRMVTSTFDSAYMTVDA